MISGRFQTNVTFLMKVFLVKSLIFHHHNIITMTKIVDNTPEVAIGGYRTHMSTTKGNVSVSKRTKHTDIVMIYQTLVYFTLLSFRSSLIMQ
jgi:hypothetical protein